MRRSTPAGFWRTVAAQRAWLPLVLAVLAAVLIVFGPVPAFGQTGGVDLNVRDTVLLPDGSTEIIVSVTGDDIPADLPADVFSVTEQGSPVADLQVEQVFDDGATLDISVAFAIDVSGSMEGEPLDLAKQGATQLVEQLTAEGVKIQLLTFASAVEILTGPTSDAGTLTAAIDGLEASGNTALYDAIGVALDGLLAQDAQANLVVFSDGDDTSSDLTREEAIKAALDAEVPINIVALESDAFAAEAVADLSAETGGRTLAATEGAELQLAFEQIAADLTSQYRLAYTSTTTDGTLELGVAVDLGERASELTYSVPNVRDAEAAEPGTPTRRIAAPGVLAGQEALIGGVLAAFLALLLVFALLFSGQRTKADRVLGDQLARYIEHSDRRAGRSGLVAAHFRDRAMEVLESAPVPSGFNERLTIKLEQAAWPLRNGEFFGLVLVAALVPAVVAGIVFNPLGGLLLGVVTGAIPLVILERRRTKRQDAFLRALPDTLQLMAGSLRAGYGVMQSVDTVAKEASGPTSEEFTRVLTEARLGMPVEDALEAMADRIGSADLRWVVLAINIQREVGGNLAELLDTVAEVLREREMLRRQIQVLSAEGRLSAIILILLPIFLAIYMVLVRPEYVSVLITNGPIGYLLIGGAVFLMLVGVVWIRKLIQIEV